MRLMRIVPVLAVLLAAPAAGFAQSEKIDYSTLVKIRDEGLNRSQAMDHVSWLSDVYGPRVTGSPAIEQAAEWAMKQMREWGLSNVHLERFAFGNGWTLQRFSAHMIEPQVMPVIGLPKSWSYGTNGVVTADVVYAPITSDADFEKYRGKLRGKIVLTQPARVVRMLDRAPIVLRMGEKEIGEALTTPIPAEPDAVRTSTAVASVNVQARRPSQQQIMAFYQEEGAAALLDRGSDSDISAGGSDLSWVTQRVDGGTIFPGSVSRDANASRLPQVTLAVEHYNRIVRVLDKGVPVRMELNIQVQFHEQTEPRGFNIIAEIPGTDPRLKDQVVMIGGHFDSTHGATGATDNATGVSAMMEAMRIIKTLGIKPRRTIRIALWGGEENGLLGSRAYVREHFGDAGSRKAEHAKLSAYFNIDNGTGRIRGIWMQQNQLVRPIFAQWIEPLKDLGVEILGPRSVTSTDHTPFDQVGLPGFQFVQERLEYNSRTHHSNMDFYDHVQRDDMVQMPVVVATFAYLAAQRDQLLPRK